MVSEGSGAGGGEDCRGSGFALRNCCTGPVCSQNLKLVRDADGNISAENQMDCSYGYCLALQEILQGFLQNTWKKGQSMRNINVWEVRNTTTTEYCYLDIDDKDYYNIYQCNIFDGRKMLDNWVPVRVELIQEDVRGNKLKPTCMPFMSQAHLAVENSFLGKLDGLCGNAYEKLKLNSDDGDFTLINIINVIDCLDLENTKYRVYKYSKEEIQKIEKFEFIRSKVEKEVIFKIKAYSLAHMFCTDIFKERMEEWGVGGLVFEKVWSAKK